ncbi:uncharacterized protein HMPREF1541_07826 [Cyphellophora europaea CBS 101466]|uniref:PAS domain-containing protein n=1 Tax=Cyphellophora europaea (strain CBS 101466) TaxID=1220924 RepID=W2RM80_CYPE1|nr:uncharacterized protein HMPREF1541_07826 [Cyphellophora europaea CBS 101466]ETN36839.1 hypothetical protein HMPREF1541_07826 [Cyphellophora europaea CBS 101466]
MSKPQANGVDHEPHELPALQADAGANGYYELEEADNPRSFDLLKPTENFTKEYSLERSSQSLFSKDHLQVIFADPTFLLRFTTFLGVHRPQSVPLLVHYLDSLKSIRAIHYANAICEGLDPVDGLGFTQQPLNKTINPALEARANAAFDLLAREELPAFICHQYIQVVSASISARITGSLSAQLREASEGLAEVFCLTDPSRPDNPIVFASEEFNRTTQYGMGYILGRNCRFLQGPVTNPHSVRRLREAISSGKQCQEVFLNYRRDGSPFMNLLMVAPLCDSRGVVRYHIGAQVDVSGLVKECVELESFQRLLELQARGEKPPEHQTPNPEKNDELRELSEMLNQNELSTIRKYGGRMHREVRDDDDESVHSHQPRLLIKDPNTLTPPISGSANGRLSGVYQHYLLVRPYPSLRILFASPSQRVPGVLQSPFMSKIGGSNRVRDELTGALAEGRGVTAKVRWITKLDEEGRNKWIHCTPLVGSNGNIGVWMVVVVDDPKSSSKFSVSSRNAPAVPSEGPKSTTSSRAHDSPRVNGTSNGYSDADRVTLGGGSVTSLRI